MDDALSFTQYPARDGFIELAFGDPDPALLPVGLIREAAQRALSAADAAGALAYGSNPGPAALRAAIAARIGEREGLALTADDVFISGGNSQALGQALTDLTRPGDVVFVECPTYNLALGVIADHPVEVVGVPMDGDGLDVDALHDAVAAARSRGRRPRLLYAIPTYHNPTGVSLSAERRRRLLELAHAEDLVIVEDDVYRELAFDGVAPPALRAADPTAPVVRLGSFSKTLAPGLRLGWIDAPTALLERFAADGVLESGGCVSQFSAVVVTALFAADAYGAHVAALRVAFASRCAALADTLRDRLPAGCTVTAPAGGYFLWVTLPDGLTAATLLPIAARRRVSFVPGRRFRTDGNDHSLRIAFSLYDEERLAEGGRRLAAAVGEALASG